MNNLFKYRDWVLHFSFLKRFCYISGETLWFGWAYRGRKKVWNPFLGSRYINDDIWISKKEYLKLLSKGSI